MIKNNMHRYRGNTGFAWIPVVLIIAFLVGGTAMVIPAVVKRSQPSSLKTSSSQTPLPTQAVRPGWHVYHSDAYGYSLHIPEGWTVKDDTFAANQEIMVSDSAHNAFVKINAYMDRTMNSVERVQEGMTQFKERMKSEPNLTVSAYKDGVEGKTGGYIAKGEQTIKGEVFQFENRGLLSTSGKVLIFHGAVKASEAAKYGDTIPTIITSFSLDK